MAAGDRRDEQQVERLLVADDDAVELAARLLAQVEQRVCRGEHGSLPAPAEPCVPSPGPPATVTGAARGRNGSERGSARMARS